MDLYLPVDSTILWPMSLMKSKVWGPNDPRVSLSLSLSTNWHLQSSIYVTSGTLSFKFLTQALTIIKSRVLTVNISHLEVSYRFYRLFMKGKLMSIFCDLLSKLDYLIRDTFLCLQLYVSGNLLQVSPNEPPKFPLQTYWHL